MANEVEIIDEEKQIKERWVNSALGIACSLAIRSYLIKKKNEWSLNIASNAAFASQNPYCKIDFSDFTFLHDEKNYTLAQFSSQTARSAPVRTNDLRGIYFSNIGWDQIEFINCDFTRSKLEESVFNSLKLNKCSLYEATFISCDLRYLVVDDSSDLSHIKFMNGCFLMKIQNLNDKNLPVPFGFEKIKYRTLLKIAKAFRKKGHINLGAEDNGLFKSHTVFLDNDLPGMSLRNTRELKEYIYWYQFIMNRLVRWKNTSPHDNRIFRLELITTKVWTSVRALGGTAAVISIFFAMLYCFIPCVIPKLFLHPIDSFYFSVVTFATLGYGDIHPEDWLGEVIVIIEVVLGYITLGAMVFLIGRIADRKY